jgi:hypothetical protein
MNTPTEHPSNRADGRAAEETLRLIASLPGPEGLEDRVKAALSAAPRRGRILHWPAGAGSAGGGWIHRTGARCAAAAAIVVVVAGGGWGVYSRVQPAPTSKTIAMPRVTAPGGFSNAGAMRTPQTLNGTLLNRPLGLSRPVTSATKQKDTNFRKDSHTARKPAKTHGKSRLLHSAK